MGLAFGLGLLGLSAYLFLLLAGRQLGDVAYAPLGASWVAVFLVAPAFFFPLEQQVARSVARCRALGEGDSAVIRQAALLAALMASGLVAGTLAVMGSLRERLFAGDTMLVWTFLFALVAYAMQYLARGWLSGREAFGLYGALIGVEGVVRLACAAALVSTGSRLAGHFAVVIGLAPLLSLLIVVPWRSKGSKKLDASPNVRDSSSLMAAGRSVLALVAASLASQTLVNAPPLVVQYVAGGADAATSGAFNKAAIITRIPLFLYQAIQAAMLPRLTHFATTGDQTAFKRLLGRVLLAVVAVGALATVLALLVGGPALRLFGSQTPLPVVDVALLAAGNSVFLVGLTISQGLVASGTGGRTTFAWFAGCVALAGVVALGPDRLLLRAELGLLVGSTVSAVVLAALLTSVWRRSATPATALAEALLPTSGIIEP